MTIIATSALTTVTILLIVGYILHEMGFLNRRVQDDEVEELRGDIQMLKEELNEANRIIALYEQLEAIETTFEDWVDEQLSTAEVVEAALAHIVEKGREKVQAVRQTELAIGLGGFRLIKKTAPEAKRTYVHYPIEDTEVSANTVSLRRVSCPH